MAATTEFVLYRDPVDGDFAHLYRFHRTQSFGAGTRPNVIKSHVLTAHMDDVPDIFGREVCDALRSDCDPDGITVEFRPFGFRSRDEGQDVSSGVATEVVA